MVVERSTAWRNWARRACCTRPARKDSDWEASMPRQAARHWSGRSSRNPTITSREERRTSRRRA
jgi:hypothetical protein